RSAVDQDMHTAELLRRLVDHAVNLFLAGDIGGKREDAPIGLAGQLPRRRLQVTLIPRNNRNVDPFFGQFSRNSFAHTPTPAGPPRPACPAGALSLTTETHATLRSWRRYKSLLASQCIVFSGGLAQVRYRRA